ncbi:hypothetical protein D1872_281830 [compost metagenome]
MPQFIEERGSPDLRPAVLPVFVVDSALQIHASFIQDHFLLGLHNPRLVRRQDQAGQQMVISFKRLRRPTGNVNDSIRQRHDAYA